MQTRPGIILQARMASSRLPGKALAHVGSRSILEHCLRRLCEGRDAMVVLATTVNREDDALDEVAERLGVPAFRGDAADVLGRFAAAASHFGLDPVIRATADNPVVDMDAAWRALRALRESDADYVCEDGLPIGAGVEGITYAALSRSAMAAQQPYDREHVTTYVKSQPQSFRIVTRRAPAPLQRPDLRLTVDTAADLEHVRAIFAGLETEMPTLRRVIEVARELPRREVA
jgi:spore coat polysaccharide biosynthesis protein SpsF